MFGIYKTSSEEKETTASFNHIKISKCTIFITSYRGGVDGFTVKSMKNWISKQSSNSGWDSLHSLISQMF